MIRFIIIILVILFLISFIFGRGGRFGLADISKSIDTGISKFRSFKSDAVTTINNTKSQLSKVKTDTNKLRDDFSSMTSDVLSKKKKPTK